MFQPFPTLSHQERPHAWAVTPNAGALKELAKGIWNCAVQTNQRPLVVLSTAGPLMGVRAALEKYRPNNLPSHIAFLPQVMSFNDWLEAAPGAWKFPKKQTDLERWLSVYINLRKHKTLQSWFKAESEAGAWGLAQAVIDACDALSEAVVPLMQSEINTLVQNQTLDAELWVKKVETLLDQAIAKAYVGLSRKVVDQESTVLLAFWRYLSSPGDPVIRKHFALAAHLQVASANQSLARPLIWVETADPKPIDQEAISQYLFEYSQFAPVVSIGMDWHSVALWSEALTGQDLEGQLKPVDDEQQMLIDRNIQASFHNGWKLLAARRFEELAWAAAKSIESHLIAGKTNIALVAQDRLAARRARALLSRFGPSLRIRDETGWKLSTTRAAASLNSWLELIRSPKEGPSASALLEFLQNPFFDIAHTLQRPAEACVSLIAQLEDILIASQAKSGWETFRMAIERANAYSSSRGSVPHESLLGLLTFLQRHHVQWLELKLDCENAYALLNANLQEMGMAQQLEKDSAGKQLLEVLKTFDLGTGTYRQVAMRLPEWLSLLKTIIEEASYQEVGQQAEATLSILPLSSTRLREFDAVVLVGCDEQQLPAFSEPPLFFSDTLNRLLKASTVTAQYIQQARDLSQLLISCPQVDLLWQSKSKSGEPLRPSAWISRLRTQLPDWPILEARSDTHVGHSAPLLESVVTVNSDIALPISMSPSAYKALRDCPYRYYVRSILGLRKAKEFEEGFDASLAGQVLHTLLKNFFQALKTEEKKSLSSIHQGEDARRDWMQEHLTKHSEKEFERLIKDDARVTGTLRDWQKQIPNFVDWQLKREADGWQYHDAELPVGFMVTMTDPDGVQREIGIAGRADRFDVNANNPTAAAVIDYKNQGITKIKKRAERLLDDPQLLIYARAVNENAIAAHLPGRTIEQAEWVSLKADLKKAEDKIVRAYSVEQMPEMMEQFSDQLNEDLEVLWARKPMKAFAPDSVCQYCEARGICRKGMW
ncbi:PD-(D/E)XK nuclease family protein [Polynucleobacter arcticus]|uniref:PD-(D/E)XK nuclease family protein n=1 Tax=Polynucleobacter arcticus TaxID=1743165 RepID=A0A6M9PLE0_9BURK|nr:PD-(D/E)XK nuclease family protein [Polynucleobacter arcticus]QKM60752.1 PD-(D/E)XK nuclease family protein [Polynucleobacter arcticus]